MITEDYVSFETAKLLKEKGFNELLNYYYTSDGRKNYATSYNWNQTTGDFQDYSCPTLQMAIKWLRRVYNLHCNVDYDFVLGWYCQITSLKETIEYDYEEMKHYHPDNDHDFSSAEEAYDAAIRYCLENLI